MVTTVCGPFLGMLSPCSERKGGVRVKRVTEGVAQNSRTNTKRRNKGGAMQGGGGGGVGWDAPPPPVPLWSPSKAGRKL